MIYIIPTQFLGNFPWKYFPKFLILPSLVCINNHHFLHCHHKCHRCSHSLHGNCNWNLPHYHYFHHCSCTHHSHIHPHPRVTPFSPFSGSQSLYELEGWQRCFPTMPWYPHLS